MMLLKNMRRSVETSVDIKMAKKNLVATKVARYSATYGAHMRQLTTQLAIAICLIGAMPTMGVAQTKAVSPTAADPLKSLAAKHDKMRGITWYRHSTSPQYINSGGFFLYFGKEDNGQFTDLRLVARYFASDWLFVKRAWAKADGVTVDIPQESNKLFGWERDNGNGDIWEWSDTALSSPTELASVRTLANAKSVTVRYEGKQYYNDRTLTAQQLKAMRDVISAYEAATGKPWK
jgi:hypothetical protein